MEFSRHDLRETTAASHIVPVLNPQGLIKWIRASNTIDTPMLSMVFKTKANGEVYLASARISQTFEDNGWELLETTFSKDGEGWRARWADYQAHMQHTLECERLGKEAGSFPAELLPDEVHERRRGEGSTAKKWAPSSAPKSKPAKRKDVA